MPEAPASTRRTTTENLLLLGAAVALILSVVKMSIIGFYPSEFPLILIGLGIAIGLGYLAERLRKERIRLMDREHGIE